MVTTIYTDGWSFFTLDRVEGELGVDIVYLTPCVRKHTHKPEKPTVEPKPQKFRLKVKGDEGKGEADAKAADAKDAAKAKESAKQEPCSAVAESDGTEEMYMRLARQLSEMDKMGADIKALSERVQRQVEDGVKLLVGLAKTFKDIAAAEAGEPEDDEDDFLD